MWRILNSLAPFFKKKNNAHHPIYHMLLIFLQINDWTTAENVWKQILEKCHH